MSLVGIWQRSQTDSAPDWSKNFWIFLEDGTFQAIEDCYLGLLVQRGTWVASDPNLQIELTEARGSSDLRQRYQFEVREDELTAKRSRKTCTLTRSTAIDHCVECQAWAYQTQLDTCDSLCTSCHSLKSDSAECAEVVADTPCVRCDTLLIDMTARNNDGFCRECFYSRESGPLRTAAEREAAVTELESTSGLALPEDYKTFLYEYDGWQNYKISTCRGKFWQLASVLPERGDCLTNPTNIDGQTQPYYEQLARYVDAAQEMTDSTSTHSPSGRVTFDRLRKGFTIGYENGDLLYLDPSNAWSVWCYFHDGADVKQLAPDFDTFIRKSKPEFKPRKATTGKLRNKLETFSGRWYCPEAKRSDNLVVEYQLDSDERATTLFFDSWSYTEAPIVTSEAYAYWRLFGKNKLGVRSEDDEYVFEILDEETLLERNPVDGEETIYKKR